ncbi:MAG: RagB/SusD family nutrient uptake outer membrane protein [Saprospirales bacterium]|nr:MAG: RagB/SusD family nutrient uptake outer membrane protein [Saprospirales bacterium]
MKLYKFIIAIILLSLTATSCFQDLDTVPLDPTQVTSGTVFDNPEAYRGVLAKLYAGLAVSGQEGPAGRPDISGIDEGFGQYLRGFWYHQQLTTDEAIIGWNDQTIFDFHNQTWTASDGFTFAFYSRIFYQIALCNEFLRETTNSKLNERGVGAALREEIQGYRAEARFLRALSYWHALDIFRNVPFVTENDVVGAFFPEQISTQDLFEYIESELLEVQDLLPPPRTNEYARADQAAAWMLLAKLYLNAETYIGQPKYAECFEYCQRIINAGYELEPEYEHLFLTDNDQSREIIFPIAFNGDNTRTWGGMTFIINAAIGGNMNPSALGMGGGWGGTRATRQFVEKFPEGSDGTVVSRNMGQTVAYPKLYVPGTHQGNDPTDTRNSLSSPMSNNIFEGHKYFPEANTEIRFTRIPSSTAPIYGDNTGGGTLQINGAPIVVPEPGLHYIRVDWNQFTYTIERRDWAIKGSIVQGSEPLPMSWNADRRALQLEADFLAGEFTFIANNDPAVTLGDNGGDRILNPGGEPITTIEVAGTYEIFLYVEQPDYSYSITTNAFDRRGMFYTQGHTLDIEDVTQFTQGYAVTKFKNISSTGVPGSNATFPDTDFPMFRLADVYLMAAEASLRGGGSTSLGIEYFNRVRERAYQSVAGNVTMEEFNLDLILDERARELYWECHRRTDLVRFGQFSDGDYVWQWKGGVQEGTQVGAHRNVFPIPNSDLNSNPNLQQNDGY